jgi:hypothetical protein
LRFPPLKKTQFSTECGISDLDGEWDEAIPEDGGRQFFGKPVTTKGNTPALAGGAREVHKGGRIQKFQPFFPLRPSCTLCFRTYAVQNLLPRIYPAGTMSRIHANCLKNS